MHISIFLHIKELEGENLSWECLLPRLIVKTVLLGFSGGLGMGVDWNKHQAKSPVWELRHFKCMQNPGIYWLVHYSTSEWKENKLLNNSEEHWNTFTWQSTLMCRELFSLWFKWKRRFLTEQLRMFEKCTANVKHLICIFYLCCVFVLSQQYTNLKTLKLSLNSKWSFPFLSDFTEISYEVNPVIIAYIFHVRHCTLMC